MGVQERPGGVSGGGAGPAGGGRHGCGHVSISSMSAGHICQASPGAVALCCGAGCETWGIRTAWTRRKSAGSDKAEAANFWPAVVREIRGICDFRLFEFRLLLAVFLRPGRPIVRFRVRTAEVIIGAGQPLTGGWDLRSEGSAFRAEFGTSGDFWPFWPSESLRLVILGPDTDQPSYTPQFARETLPLGPKTGHQFGAYIRFAWTLSGATTLRVDAARDEHAAN